MISVRSFQDKNELFNSQTVICYLCGFQSPVKWARPVQSVPTYPSVPYFPILNKLSPAEGSLLRKDGSTTLCAFCHASLEAQWKEYERQGTMIHPEVREYKILKFICAVCGVETYRRRTRAVPLLDFPFLQKKRHPGSITLGNRPFAVVCLDCCETLWAQSDEYDRCGVPMKERHYNWMTRAPPPEKSVEATFARLPSGETQLPKSNPLEPTMSKLMDNTDFNEAIGNRKRAHELTFWNSYTTSAVVTLLPYTQVSYSSPCVTRIRQKNNNGFPITPPSLSISQTQNLPQHLPFFPSLHPNPPSCLNFSPPTVSSVESSRMNENDRLKNSKKNSGSSSSAKTSITNGVDQFKSHSKPEVKPTTSPIPIQTPADNKTRKESPTVSCVNKGNIHNANCTSFLHKKRNWKVFIENREGSPAQGRIRCTSSCQFQRAPAQRSKTETVKCNNPATSDDLNANVHNCNDSKNIEVAKECSSCQLDFKMKPEQDKHEYVLAKMARVSVIQCTSAVNTEPARPYSF